MDLKRADVCEKSTRTSGWFRLLHHAPGTRSKSYELFEYVLKNPGGGGVKGVASVPRPWASWTGHSMWQLIYKTSEKASKEMGGGGYV